MADPDEQQYFPLLMSGLPSVGGTTVRVRAQLDTTVTPLSDLIIADVRVPLLVRNSAIVGGAIGAIGIISPFRHFEQKSTWMFGMTDEFRKQIDNIDRKMQGRILQTIAIIVDKPTEPHGDVQKPLTKEERYAGCWRYRIGDFRLIYYPDSTEKRILFVSFDSRGDVYS